MPLTESFSQNSEYRSPGEKESTSRKRKRSKHKSRSRSPHFHYDAKSQSDLKRHSSGSKRYYRGSSGSRAQYRSTDRAIRVKQNKEKEVGIIIMVRSFNCFL